MKTLTEYEIDYAKQQGRDAIAQARSTLEGALKELDRYAARFEEAESATDKANVLNWTLGHLATYISNNVRLDMIATAQANLMRADALK